MDEDQRAELRYELGDRIDRLWDLLGLPVFRKPDFGVCADGTLVRLHFERSVMVREEVADDASELLYWAVRDAMYGREWTWGRQVAALYALDPVWAERWCAELAARVGPERQHEVPELPPEEPFVLRPPKLRARRSRIAARAKAAERAARTERPPVRLPAAFVSPTRFVDSCNACRVRRRTPSEFPRFRLLDQ
ncbi:hypothetical protein OG401_10920 [Kitasatospora purpeofusca]|uniref:hypothetical protein n=1 Tax=Kitasatospora purpeofusca TaxID=67352 RepID=UPI0022538C91|nr:hypothetical protein [Kitasatospora purpeofusca]MCX4684816.1 hypothetical protein [Kitasatospora purpeofusca]